MRSDQYVTNVRRDGTASYLELNPETPPTSSRVRGWEDLVVERELFFPFDNGEVVYDEHFIGMIQARRTHMRYAVDGREYEGVYHKGDIVLSPAGQPVRWRLDDASEALIVAIRPSLWQRVVEQVTGLDPDSVQIVAQPKSRDPLIQTMTQTLMSEVEGGGLGERLYVESVATALVIHLIRHYSSIRQPDLRPAVRGLSGPGLRRALDYINDHLDASISLAELAQAAGVSVSHFTTLFKRSTGASPHQYLLRCRVELAKDLLRQGDESLTLAQIAARVGFCDQGHLTRHFQRLEKTTPSSYRNLSSDRPKNRPNIQDSDRSPRG
jgi:AraC family transcriptional regulator